MKSMTSCRPVLPPTPRKEPSICQHHRDDILPMPVLSETDTGLSWDLANGPATSSTMRQSWLKNEDSGLEPLVISAEGK
jgi:hypothetical protein